MLESARFVLCNGQRFAIRFAPGGPSCSLVS